jgi:lipopolysaccharide transport system ATP-binding protein
MAHLRLTDAVVDVPAVEPGAYSLKLALLGLAGRGGGQPMPTIRVIDGISLDLTPGMRIGLQGPNGAGKSTLLRVLAGIYPLASGSYERSGRVSALLGLDAGINPETSAETNIRTLLRIDGVEPTAALVDEIWAFTEIDDRFRRLPLRSFSTGMRLRLLFAVATSVEADIVLLDEWLSVADRSFAIKAEQRLRAFVDKAKILVFASHSEQTIRALASEVITMAAGRIVARGAPEP